jgi:hypothetical protein
LRPLSTKIFSQEKILINKIPQSNQHKCTFIDIHGGYRTIRQADDDAKRGYRFGDGNEYAEAKNLDKRLAVAPRRGSVHSEEFFEEKFHEEVEYEGDSDGGSLEEVSRVVDHKEKGSHSRIFNPDRP